MKQLSPFKKRLKRAYPNQMICTLLANGVMCNECYYPFKVWTYTDGDFPAKKGIRIYIKSALLSQYKVAADAGTYLYLRAYQNSKVVRMIQFNTPALTDCGYMYAYADCGYLLDETPPAGISNIFYLTADAFPTSYASTVVYAEVDTEPGLNKPLVVEE